MSWVKMALEQIKERRETREETVKHIRYSLLGARYELEQAAAGCAIAHIHTLDIKLQQALERVNTALMADALKP